MPRLFRRPRPRPRHSRTPIRTIISRHKTGHDLTAVPPVDFKIGIRGQHHGIGQRLAHAHQAGIRQAHGHVGVFDTQVKHLVALSGGSVYGLETAAGVNGSPVFEGPQVQLGAEESYQAVCSKCYEKSANRASAKATTPLFTQP